MTLSSSGIVPGLRPMAVPEKLMLVAPEDGDPLPPQESLMTPESVEQNVEDADSHER